MQFLSRYNHLQFPSILSAYLFPASINLSISIELSQSFFLIHDDIIDRSDLRRGFKSFHRKVEEMLGDIKDKEHMAESLAIVAGDLAVDYSFDALNRSDFPLDIKYRAMGELIEIIKTTGYGEVL